MSGGQDRGRLDWLVELAGAGAPALAALVAAAKLAPGWGWPVSLAAPASGGIAFALAYLAMRAVRPEPRALGMSGFEPTAIEEADELLLDQIHGDDCHELLLDQPLDEASGAVAELLLDDPLPAPAPESRVVALFAEGRMPTAGQLASRIDRHLADGGRAAPPPAADASDILSEALAELRRSLRHA